MNVGLEQNLHKCLDLLSENWNSQNNKEDKVTNFIYQCNTLDECMFQVKKQDVDVQYALHRWYNYKTSSQKNIGVLKLTQQKIEIQVQKEQWNTYTV